MGAAVHAGVILVGALIAAGAFGVFKFNDVHLVGLTAGQRALAWAAVAAILGLVVYVLSFAFG